MLILQATFYAFLAIILLIIAFLFGFKLGFNHMKSEAIKLIELMDLEAKTGIHIKKSTFQEKLAERMREAEKRHNSKNN